MYHTVRTVLCVLIGLVIMENVNSADSSTLPKGILASITSNVGSVLTPTLVNEIRKLYPNLTSVDKPGDARVLNPTAVLARLSDPNSKTTAPAKSLETRTKSDVKPVGKLALQSTPAPSADSERAPQTQLENQFPFDFRNRFGDGDFAGAGLQGTSGRQFNGGIFPDRDSFNSEIYRPFTSSLDGTRAGENGFAGPGSRLGPQESIFGGVNRPFNAADSPQDFNRFQEFGRFGLDGRLSGSNRFFDQSFRSGADSDRFSNFPGGAQDPRSGLVSNNFRQDLNNNFQNSPLNDPRQSSLFPGTQLPQNYAQNFFDLQRFQSPFAEGIGRDQQRGPANFPLFFPAQPAGNAGPPAGQNQNREPTRPLTTSSPARRVSDDREILESEQKKNSSNAGIVEEQTNQFDRFYYPPLADYSDVRVHSDAFKERVASNILDARAKNNIV